MKKEIGVFLKYPWGLPDSPYYKYLLAAPPKNVSYTNQSQGKYDVIENKKKFEYLKKSKKLIRGLLRFSPVAPVLKVKKFEGDIVHGAHCLIRDKKIPYVADMEHVANFTATSTEVLSNPLIKSQIKKIMLRPNLTKIMPWTEKSQEGIRQHLGNKLFKKVEDKLKIIYPAVPVIERKKEKCEKISILFAARYFFEKGGLYVCEVAKRLKNKYDVEFNIIGPYPEGFEKKYPEVNFTGMIPRDVLIEKYFKKADIFLYPGFSDTFGFAILEAMSMGIPVITVETYCKKELIENNKSGIVVDTDHHPDYFTIEDGKIVENLVEKCSEIIENKKTLNAMSRNAQKEITTGKFSIGKRNKEMYNVYMDCKHRRI